jgi:hypothetical protein
MAGNCQLKPTRIFQLASRVASHPVALELSAHVGTGPACQQKGFGRSSRPAARHAQGRQSRWRCSAASSAAGRNRMPLAAPILVHGLREARQISYLKTDRGRRSLDYLIALARELWSNLVDERGAAYPR